MSVPLWRCAGAAFGATAATFSSACHKATFRAHKNRPCRRVMRHARAATLSCGTSRVRAVYIQSALYSTRIVSSCGTSRFHAACIRSSAAAGQSGRVDASKHDDASCAAVVLRAAAAAAGQNGCAMDAMRHDDAIMTYFSPQDYAIPAGGMASSYAHAGTQPAFAHSAVVPPSTSTTEQSANSEDVHSCALQALSPAPS